MAREHLLLTVQRLVVGPFRHDDVGQETCSRRALLNRLRGFLRRLHRAVAGVAAPHVFDHLKRRRNVFVTLAGFFRDQPQIPAAAATVFLRFRQVVYYALARDVSGQRLPRGAFLHRRRGRFRQWIRRTGFGLFFGVEFPPEFFEQSGLLRRQPFALTRFLSFRKLADHLRVLVLLGRFAVPFPRRAVQLLRQIDHDLLQRGLIFGQRTGIERQTPG